MVLILSMYTFFYVYIRIDYLHRFLPVPDKSRYSKFTSLEWDICSPWGHFVMSYHRTMVGRPVGQSVVLIETDLRMTPAYK